MKLHRFAAVALLLVASAAHAHVVSDRDLKVIRGFPSASFTEEWRASLPDSAGYVAPNRSGKWSSVAHQRGAMRLVLDAAARDDTAGVERVWSALDAAWVQQIPGGSFRRSEGVDEGIANALWVGASSRAVIGVMNSKVAGSFRWRWALMRPKLQNAVDFLEARGDSLLRLHDRDGCALLVLSAAFLLADGTYHDERYGRLGQAALARALELQKSDGSFPSNGTVNVARNALALESLQTLAIYFPLSTLDRAAARSTKWMTHKGRGAREFSGGSGWPPVTRREIEFALAYARIPPPPPMPSVTH